jgi:hypothetical protein
MNLVDRIEWIQKALDAARQTTKTQDAILGEAPQWFKADTPLHKVQPERRPVFSKLVRAGKRRAAAQAAIDELTEVLHELERQPERVRVCYERALAWINNAETAADLISVYRSDPASSALGEARGGGLPPRLAHAILTFRDQQPRRQLTRLEDLAQVDGISEAILRDLVYTGCFLPTSTLPEQPLLGVMMPVRLETRFYQPQNPGEQWRLRVRVIPEDASIDRHDPLPTEDELNGLETMWQNAGGTLEGTAAEDAWRVFAGRFGGARAAWLARSFPPVTDDEGNISVERPAQLSETPRMNQLRGMPDTIELWMGRGGAEPVHMATLNVDQDAVTELDFPDFRTMDDVRWWNSYTEAARVGMATEIQLGTEQPDDIDVLYAVGLSDESPQALFESHRDSGDLAVLELGDSTNTVDGEHAVDLGQDPASWLELAKGESAWGSLQLSWALIGNGNSLDPIPGPASSSPWTLNKALVNTLWFVLWGHALKDIWGLGVQAHLAGYWAAHYLYPEGPLPPIRIGEQPYGILPATSLSRWQSQSEDPPVEEAMRESLIALRAAWAQAAETTGTVTDADTEKLLDLLGRTPNSSRYMFRSFLPLNTVALLYLALVQGVDISELEDWWDQHNTEIMNYPVDPRRRYAAYGYPRQLRIPLVEARNLPEGMSWQDALHLLQKMPVEVAVDLSQIREWFDGELPDSLLMRLLMHAFVVSAAEVHRAETGMTEPVLEQEFAVDSQPTRLELDALAMVGHLPGNHPVMHLFNAVREWIDPLAAAPLEQVERAFRSVMDTAAYRVDPWITGMAWRRHRELSGQLPRLRLGVYGWVDQPKPGGAGPTDGGLLHAPSEAQCYTAMIIRDKAINDPEADRWHMDLDSRTVREAARLAEAVRAGNHLQEVLGREVERIVDNYPLIHQLRQDFPIRTEHEGRRVCNGQAVLAADLDALGLPADKREALQTLRAAVDAYGDLLVAEAVHNVVSGRGEIAGAAMEAAAGLTSAPTLEVLTTPRSGRTVASTAVFCLPTQAAPAITAQTSPTLIADPAVAKWIEQQTGAPDSAAWTWQVIRSDDTSVAVTLDALQLLPYDTISIARDTLHRLVISTVADGDHIDEQTSDAIATHESARRLISVVGSRPALPEDLVTDGSQPDPGPVAEELRQRLNNLINTAQLARDAMAASLSADEAAQRSALHLALRWGISTIPEAELSLTEQVQGAIDMMDDRIAAAPTAPEALAAPDLAKAIAELATSDGRYAVLARIDLADLGVALTHDDRPADQPINPLDEAWLSVVATVRPPLARVEACQLEALTRGEDGPLFAWTSRPGDPWQTAEPADPETDRPPDTRMLVAYGPEHVLDELEAGTPSVVRAVGLVDSWSEVIPATQHDTTAGFGFNAPAARAPQGILLAVPPADPTQLDNETLVQIVHETRELAHARMATAEDLSGYASAIPTMMFPAMGDTRVWLRPVLFPNEPEEE